MKVTISGIRGAVPGSAPMRTSPCLTGALKDTLQGVRLSTDRIGGETPLASGARDVA